MVFGRFTNRDRRVVRAWLKATPEHVDHRLHFGQRSRKAMHPDGNYDGSQACREEPAVRMSTVIVTRQITTYAVNPAS